TQSDTKAHAIHIFDVMWKDNVKARRLVGDHYERIDRGDVAPFSSQEYFVKQAMKLNAREKKEKKAKKHFSSVFETLTRHVPNLHLDERKDE
ncbi:RNA degradosome polyphosphate kinase, partial [Lactobacillus reuteri]|nr:RNA degradosome polyphosphate kinase [Limosilactobacillus reuteri]